MDYLLDRSWMSRRRMPSHSDATSEFKEGCDRFVEYAYNKIACVNERNEIRCPCKVCKNKFYLPQDRVKFDLYRRGFMNSYLHGHWWGHGEAMHVSVAPTQESTNQSFPSRMNDMVRDLAGPDFNWEHSGEDPMDADVADFFKLLEVGSEPLWKGCAKHTTLSAVSTLLNIKADSNMSQECFEALLKAIKSMLPEDENLPTNFHYCKKMLKNLGLGYQKIDACENDCMLYYKENEHLAKCKVCNHERFKPSGEGKKCKVPYKVLRYFPIADRLKRLYLSSKTAKHMSWHSRSTSKAGEMCHPADGEAWKHFNTCHPEFALEPRNVRLGLSCDGFNPFGPAAKAYSCWPVIVTPYNLPPWMCMKQEYMFLSLIIPGPESPNRNIDLYLTLYSHHHVWPTSS